MSLQDRLASRAAQLAQKLRDAKTQADVNRVIGELDRIAALHA